MRCLSTGWNGGFTTTDAIYAYSVPTDWEHQDIEAYAASRDREVGFDGEGPSLFTAVDLEHLRGARAGPAEVFATVGLSNPASLPMDPNDAPESAMPDDDQPVAGTVNLVVGTTRSLDNAALANLLAVAVEAKAVTLVAQAGFPGTTTDAVVVASDPTGEQRSFSGSATEVGTATRACVREAVRASLASSYPNGEFPGSVEEAEHGVTTELKAEVFVIR